MLASQQQWILLESLIINVFSVILNILRGLAVGLIGPFGRLVLAAWPVGLTALA